MLPEFPLKQAQGTQISNIKFIYLQQCTRRNALLHLEAILSAKLLNWTESSSHKIAGMLLSSGRICFKQTSALKLIQKQPFWHAKCWLIKVGVMRFCGWQIDWARGLVPYLVQQQHNWRRVIAQSVCIRETRDKPFHPWIWLHKLQNKQNTLRLFL